MDQIKPTISRAMAIFTTLAFSVRPQPTISVAESNLCFPPDVANDFWQRLDPVDLVTADAQLHSVSPSALDQRAPSMAVTGFGNAAVSNGLTT
jgi:hypothetical protein